MKLHKLVYYSQAWSLVWDGRPLFRDRIEAWVNGPVVRRLYTLHRGEYEVSRRHFTGGSSAALSSDQRESIDIVLEHYGSKTASWLSELTHREQPWHRARTGLAPLERGESAITQESMYEYYDGISQAQHANA